MICPRCGDSNDRDHPYIAQSHHRGRRRRIVVRICKRCKEYYPIISEVLPEHWHKRTTPDPNTLPLFEDSQ